MKKIARIFLGLFAMFSINFSDPLLQAQTYPMATLSLFRVNHKKKSNLREL